MGCGQVCGSRLILDGKPGLANARAATRALRAVGSAPPRRTTGIGTYAFDLASGSLTVQGGNDTPPDVDGAFSVQGGKLTIDDV